MRHHEVAEGIRFKSPKLSQFRTRQYQPGDETALVELWNAAHAEYGGHVPRTVDLWKWSILDRPGVTPEDILVIDAHDEVIAYGALGRQTGPYGGIGNVLEQAVVPWLSKRTRVRVATFLVTALEDRCRSRGDELIQFALPGPETPILRVFEKAGYTTETSESFQLVTVDLAGLLEQILEHRRPETPDHLSQAFLFEMASGDYRFCPHARLMVQPGGSRVVSVVDETAGADVTVSTHLSRSRISRSEATFLRRHRTKEAN